MRNIITSAALIACAIALGGCATASIGSVGGGECRLTHTPEFAVRGKAPYDQRWINKTTEALVDGCRQPRPKARPASFDAPAKTVSPAPKPKKRLLRRIFGS